MKDLDMSKLEVWKFAGKKQDCDNLFNLVKIRQKTAIKTTKFEVKKFCEVSEEFAYKEGEGDRSLKYWKRIYEDFFKKRCKAKNIKFDNNILIVCEEFEVVQEDCYGKKKI